MSRVLILVFSLAVLPFSASGDQPFDYRSMWQAWPVATQVGYVYGFIAGVEKARTDLIIMWMRKFGLDDGESVIADSVIADTAKYGRSLREFDPFKLYETVDGCLS